MRSSLRGPEHTALSLQGSRPGEPQDGPSHLFPFWVPESHTLPCIDFALLYEPSYLWLVWLLLIMHKAKESNNCHWTLGNST